MRAVTDLYPRERSARAQSDESVTRRFVIGAVLLNIRCHAQPGSEVHVLREQFPRAATDLV
jgi:hypothetical protein